MLKRVISFVLVFSMVATMVFSFPLSSKAAENTIDVLLEAQYDAVYLMYGETDIYLVYKDGLWGLYSADGYFITNVKWDNINRFNEYGTAVVRKDRQYGVISRLGQEIVPAAYDIIDFDAGLIKVCKNGLWGLLNADGTMLLAPKYQQIENFDGEYAKVFLNGKYGYINSLGEEKVSLIWADTTCFSDGLFAVMNNFGLWGYVNELNQTVIACTYSGAGTFLNGKAWVVKTNGTSGAIYKNGSVAIAFNYQPIYNCDFFTGPVFSEGVAAVKKIGQFLYSIIDENGNILKENAFYQIEAFQDGTAKFRDWYGSCGLAKLDKSTAIPKVTIATNEPYGDIFLLNENPKLYFALTPYGIGNEYGYSDGSILNSDGSVIVRQTNSYDFEYSSGHFIAGSFDDMGYYFYGLYDVQGNVLIAPNQYGNLKFLTPDIILYSKYDYDGGGTSSSGIVSSSNTSSVSSSTPTSSSKMSSYANPKTGASLKSSNATGQYLREMGFLNLQGEPLTNKTYEYVESRLDNGYIKAYSNDLTIDYLDLDFNTILSGNEWMDARYAGYDMFAVEKDGKWGFVGVNGFSIAPQYDSVSDFKEGLAWFIKGIKAGAINLEGEEVIAPEWTANYDCTGFAGNLFTNGVAAVKKIANGKYSFIDKNGNKISNYEYDFVTEFNENNIAVFGIGEQYGLLKLSSTADEGYVKVKPTGITVNPTRISLYVDTTVAIIETVFPSNATNKEVSFSSNNEAVAMVDTKGRVTGVAKGTTSITITSKDNGNIQKTVSVSVKEKTTGSHSPEEIVPDEAWEGQYWFKLMVLIQSGLDYMNLAEAEITYGDLEAFTQLFLMNFDVRVFAPALSVSDEVFIPKIIGEFKNLLRLEISDSLYNSKPIGGELPFEISYLSNLQEITIRNTDISGLTKHIVNLENLRVLDLSANKFNLNDPNNQELLATLNALTQKGVKVILDNQKIPVDYIFPSQNAITIYPDNYNSIYLNTFPYTNIPDITVQITGTAGIDARVYGNTLQLTATHGGGEGTVILFSNGEEKARIKVTVMGEFKPTISYDESPTKNNLVVNLGMGKEMGSIYGLYEYKFNENAEWMTSYGDSLTVKDNCNLFVRYLDMYTNTWSDVATARISNIDRVAPKAPTFAVYNYNTHAFASLIRNDAEYSQMFYRIDASEVWQQYDYWIYVAGPCTLEAYSVDSVGNKSPISKIEIKTLSSQQSNGALMSNLYKISDSGFISNINPSTSVSSFKSAFVNEQAKLSVLDSSGNVCADYMSMATGMKLCYTLQNGDKEYYDIVIYGDISGDGIINSLDILKLKRHLLKGTELEGAYLEAANINHRTDGPITVSSLVRLSQYVLGYTDIKQDNTPFVNTPKVFDVLAELTATTDYLINNKTVITNTFEALSLAANGYMMDDGVFTFDRQYSFLDEAYLDATDGREVISNIEFIFLAKASGQDPATFIDGKNLVEMLVAKQEIDGSYLQEYGATIYAMLALDLANADYDKENAVQVILANQNADGGFGYEMTSNLDNTTFVLMALSKYRGFAGVDEAINRAVSYIKSQQNEDGSFDSDIYTENGVIFGESIGTEAEIITALVECGYDVFSAEFKDLPYRLLKFKNPDGSYRYTADGINEYDEYSTSSVLMALTTLKNGMSPFKSLAGNQ